MHMEIQVALNFVISYLYNKLPRRRVNIFGEELEKALREKFQGHWYPEKPFKGSAYRCLKTGDPIDPVLARAAHESGVPIVDILDNLPNELSVWVDPGEVSYRIGEKGIVKILYTESDDNHEDNNSADREVNKMFNPEAQCFRPIDIVNSVGVSVNALSLSTKTSPIADSSPYSPSSNSPTYKGSPNANSTTNNTFMQRVQAPLTFTTAAFAQTKFGSTKLKTNSKRTNSSYRMSPTEFSNYIKQRAVQQQLHHGHGTLAANQVSNYFGSIDSVSPARSLSPNPQALGGGQITDRFYFSNMSMGMFPQFNGHRNIFETQFTSDSSGLQSTSPGCQNKFNAYIDPPRFYGIGGHLQLQTPSVQPVQKISSQPLQQKSSNSKTSIDVDYKESNASKSSVELEKAQGDSQDIAPNPAGIVDLTKAAAACPVTSTSTNQDLIDSLSSFYTNTTATGSYQQLLVA